MSEGESMKYIITICIIAVIATVDFFATKN